MEIRRTPSLFERRRLELSTMDAFLRQPQADFSKSYHELDTVGLHPKLPASASFRPTIDVSLRRRKSAVELTGLEGKYRFDVAENNRQEECDDRPVVRRKRFTRKQRKSVTIEPNTGLILAVGVDSSSDEDTQNSSRRGLSASTTALIPKDELLKKKSQPRGPAARRVSRRALKSQQNSIASSVNNLNRIDEDFNKLKQEKRSMSVRDLNGEEIDFTNQDSVTRWTSQILAELDSLPSSRVNLHEVGRHDTNHVINNNNNVFDKKYATLQSSTTVAPPIPPHGRLLTSNQPRMTKSSIMTSSLSSFPTTSSLKNQLDGDPLFKSSNYKQPSPNYTRPNYMSQSVTMRQQYPIPWMTEQDNRMTQSEVMSSSIDDVMRSSLYSNNSTTSTRDREDSVNSSTLVGSSTDSDGEGTPLAGSPIPFEKTSTPQRFEVHKNPSDDMANRRSIGSQKSPIMSRHSEHLTTQSNMDISSPPSPARPIPAKRTRLTVTSNNVLSYSDSRSPLNTVQNLRSLDEPRERKSPQPARRTAATLSNNTENRHVTDKSPKMERNGVKMRGESTFLEESDQKLLNSIARLTQSVYGDLREIGNESACSSSTRLSVPSIVMNDGLSSDSAGLDKWQKRAQCRARQEAATTSTSPRQSVNRVVASLIRSIEDSRHTAPDRPTHLSVDQNAQDVSTQTSPFSASRSSSFDYIHEPTEGRLRDIKTPVATPNRLPNFASSSRIVESSSETDDADREVAAMTGKQESTDRKQRETTLSREIPDNIERDRILDESIQMLLEYGNHSQPKPSTRKQIPRQTSNEANSLGLSYNTTSSQKNSDSLPSDSRKSLVHQLSGGSSVPAMNESLYDNLPKSRIRQSEPLSPLSKSICRDESLGSLLSDSDVPMTPEHSLNSIDKSIDNILNFENRLNGYTVRSKAGSCEQLTEIENKDSDASHVANLRKAEEDAIQCCDWLRKAGFPQYAVQYEENRFPIDLRAAQKDHPFLDKDSLTTLCRRLQTLNRCAIMKIDKVVLRQRNDDYSPYTAMYNGMEDDDNVALSNNWQYQRHSHTWSRVGNEQMYGAHGRTVSTKPNYDSYRNGVDQTREYHTAERRSEKKLERYDDRTTAPITNDNNGAAVNTKLQRSQSERIKERARAIMKKMDLRSSSRRRKESSRPRDPSQMVIGDPVLVSYDSASPETMRMFPKNITRPTELSARGRPVTAERQPRSKSARRQGMVLLSPSSPESSSTDDSFRSPHQMTSSMSRRDRSVPPRMMSSTRETYDPRQEYYGSHASYAPYERFSMTRRAHEDHCYPNSPASLKRTTRGINPPSSYLYDTPKSVPYYSTSGEYNSPTYSSPYAGRSQQYTSATLERTRPIVHDDGYYMHGLSPDSSLSRVRQLRQTGSPSTSGGSVPQLRVDIRGNKLQSQSSLDNTDEEQSSSITAGRRDSGVGSSLSRSPSGPSTQRLRQSVLPYCLALTSSLTSTNSLGSWQNAKRRIPAMTSSVTSSTSEEAFFTDVQLARCVDSLSVLEMTRMRKLAYLRITAILEKYMGPGAANKLSIGTTVMNGGSVAQKNWTVQKLIKKIKHMDGKNGKEVEESVVFGQPLDSIYKRTGLSLPRSILEILRYLRQLAPDTVGIFRKNGVKSRITELRSVCDRDTDVDVFVDENRLDASQVHDVADLLKQYLRELPDPLMTSRLSESFANIFIHVPENERLLALQFAVLLLPDEHREALQTLLFFLNDVARHSDANNMPAQNIAVCFAPSLFQLSASRLDKITPTRRHKTIGAAGMPTEREMRETRAAQLCLSTMITECRTIFVAPDSGPEERVDTEDDTPLLKELRLEGTTGPKGYLKKIMSDMLKEHSDRWKSWIVEGNSDGVEISCRKSTDNNPLRLFRVWVDIEAPPKEVMARIMKERNVWDVSVVNWRCIDSIHPDVDVHQYVINDTIGHPTRDCFVVRYHRTDLAEIRGACAIVERSVQCSQTQLLGGVSAAVFDSKFLIEPTNSGRSRLTHISRVDLRGRSINWYNKVYGNILARQMSRLRESFHQLSEDAGPETKV